VSSASADVPPRAGARRAADAAGGCPRLDALEVEQLPGGLRLARAKRFAERARGLARLDAMPPGYALHIPHCRSVHTFTMRFPLDLIWLGKDGRPVRVDRAVAPNRHKSCRRARSVIEANAGTADAFLTAIAR